MRNGYAAFLSRRGSADAICGAHFWSQVKINQPQQTMSPMMNVQLYVSLPDLPRKG
jgi:hypothetical protein